MKYILSVLLIGFSVTAFGADSELFLGQAREFLKNEKLDKVTVQFIGPLLVFGGQVDSISQNEKLEALVQGFQQTEPKVSAQNIAKVSEDAWKALAEKIEKEIGSPDITVRFIDGRSLLLEGLAQNDFEADRAVAVSKIYSHHTKSERATASTEKSLEIVDMLRVKPRSGVASSTNRKKK